jgi:hypothetical protein
VSQENLIYGAMPAYLRCSSNHIRSDTTPQIPSQQTTGMPAGTNEPDKRPEPLCTSPYSPGCLQEARVLLSTTVSYCLFCLRPNVYLGSRMSVT